MANRLLSREIAAVLVIKLIALATIHALFFSPAHRPAIDASERLLGAAAPSNSAR